MTLKINGVDILPFIADRGIRWQRNDLDGANAGRTMDGTMYRERVASKVRLDITCLPLKSEDAAMILNLIFQEYVEVEYTDPMYGDVYKTMYSNNTPASYINTKTNRWEGIVFPLIER